MCFIHFGDFTGTLFSQKKGKGAGDQQIEQMLFERTFEPCFNYVVFLPGAQADQTPCHDTRRHYLVHLNNYRLGFPSCLAVSCDLLLPLILAPLSKIN